MVEVFKTDVSDITIAGELLVALLEVFPDHKINFDLDDCDKILRVESQNVIASDVAYIMSCRGFFCQALE